jgi:hypothetical protein
MFGKGDAYKARIIAIEGLLSALLRSAEFVRCAWALAYRVDRFISL